MFHYNEPLDNTKGQALTGFYIRCVDATTNNSATLYADENLTPILSVSGLANAAQADDDGMVSFYVASGTYHLDVYAPDGSTFIKRYRNIPMVSNIFDAGGVVTATASGFGYSVGNGGAVTQPTNKATAVTINKPTGSITMNGAALASNAVISFIVFNSCVSPTDTVVVNLKTGSYATTGTYFVQAESISSGAFAIGVKNLSGGSLSEALVVNFAIIKGQNS